MTSPIVKRIAIFVDDTMYDSTRHFSIKLAEALERQGVSVSIIDSKGQPLEQDKLRQLFDHPPDFTCSFNRMEPLSDGSFLWDHLKIPHVSFLVDPALYFMDLTKSPYTVLTAVDRADCAAVKQEGFKPIFFWPHAVERDLEQGTGERPYEVVFFGSCFDYNAWRRHWEQNLPEPLWQVVEDACELVLADDQVSLADALAGSWDRHKPSIDPRSYFMIMFHYVDKYTRGYDRIHLIKGIKDAAVHVFGDVPPDRVKQASGWSGYIGDQPNVVVRKSVPFKESLKILQKSKLCLNSIPFFRDGTHERIFTGLMAGCLPITSDSRYLREQFSHPESLLFYRAGAWSGVNELVNRYLDDDRARKKIVEAGRKVVMQSHTWDQRAQELIGFAGAPPPSETA